MKFQDLLFWNGKKSTQHGWMKYWDLLEKFCNFYPHLSLERVFPGLKLTQNCYINIFLFLFWNGKKSTQYCSRKYQSLLFWNDLNSTWKYSPWLEKIVKIKILNCSALQSLEQHIQKSQFSRSLCTGEKFGSID